MPESQCAHRILNRYLQASHASAVQGSSTQGKRLDMHHLLPLLSLPIDMSSCVELHCLIADIGLTVLKTINIEVTGKHKCKSPHVPQDLQVESPPCRSSDFTTTALHLPHSLVDH